MKGLAMQEYAVTVKGTQVKLFSTCLKHSAAFLRYGITIMAIVTVLVRST